MEQEADDFLAEVSMLLGRVDNLAVILLPKHNPPHIGRAVAGLWDQIKLMAPEQTSEKVWRNVQPLTQEVFIEPLHNSAFVRLNSYIAQFINCLFLKHPIANALAGIKHYLEVICDLFNLNHEKLITY